MSFATQRAAIIKWLSIGSGFTEDKVIWTDQNMPRPVRPYISVNMTRFKTINREVITLPDSNGKSKIIEHKEFVLPIQIYADNNAQPDTLQVLSNVQSIVHTQQIQDLFSKEGIVFVRVLFGPDCTATRIDVMSEERAAMDIQMRMPWVTEDGSQGSIESTNVEGIVVDIDGTTRLNKTFSSGAPFIPEETSANDLLFVYLDKINELVILDNGTDTIEMYYPTATTITLNGDSVLITDLKVGDNVDIIYFEYNGKHSLKTVTATRI
jgi:hypothetical protein